MDRYRVDAHIDTGSSAEVYKVTHTWLYQPMILKHLRADLPAELRKDLRSALLEEGRLQCEVNHQNLVAVHDALEVEGRPALVMEFVDGPDLADWIDAREVPPLLEAIALFRGIVAGIEVAHSVPVVHRDLKPENVLLARRKDGTFVPKIADFGLAKRMKPRRSQVSLSDAYTLIGTPEYMAPEQIHDPSVVDTRADLFSLGAILYELCTGQVAFDALDSVQVLDRVVKGDFVAPGRMRPGLPPLLGSLIEALLEPIPRDRPQSAAVVLDLLDEIAMDMEAITQD